MGLGVVGRASCRPSLRSAAHARVLRFGGAPSLRSAARGCGLFAPVRFLWLRSVRLAVSGFARFGSPSLASLRSARRLWLRSVRLAFSGFARFGSLSLASVGSARFLWLRSVRFFQLRSVRFASSGFARVASWSAWLLLSRWRSRRFARWRRSPRPPGGRSTSRREVPPELAPVPCCLSLGLAGMRGGVGRVDCAHLQCYVGRHARPQHPGWDIPDRSDTASRDSRS